MDKFGIIDIATSMFRYWDEPYILASNAEPVFYVPIVNKPGCSTVVLVRPRNLFSMPDTRNDVDALDVGIQEMKESGQGQEFLNWSRQDRAGTAIINEVRSEAIPEPINDYISDDDSDDDDTYIDDGVIAPVVEKNREDDFFV